MTTPAQRKKLLVLASTYPRWAGDPEPGFVHELSKRLTDVFEVAVLCPHAQGAMEQEVLDGVYVTRYRYAPSAWETLVNHGGITTNLRNKPWKWLLLPCFLFAQFWATWTNIRRYQPDIVHAHWLIPQGLFIAVLKLIDKQTPPFLVTSHGADVFAFRSRPMQALKRFVTQQAAVLTVVSQTMREELLQLEEDQSKIEVMPMGVDLSERFTPDPAITRSNNEILFVGRLVEKKGVRFLLDAMPKILALHPAAHLLIAGFGPEEVALKRQVEQLGLQNTVQFLGAITQTELPALYRRAAVMVAPFVQAENGDVEGLGLVVVEALGCACPVIVGDVPAVYDLIPKDSGWIVPPAGAEKFAASIVAILTDQPSAQQKVHHIRLSLLNTLSWQTIAARYVALIHSILRNKTVSP
jgi:glycosyltransferase involved in cell wall biosynthesis